MGSSGREACHSIEIDVRNSRVQNRVPKVEFEIVEPSDETGMTVKLYKKIQRGKKMLRFAHVTDGHYGSDRGGDSYIEDARNENGEMDDLLVQRLNDRHADEPFDFLVYTGDKKLNQNDVSDHQVVRDNLYNKLDMPWYPVHGDHGTLDSDQFDNYYSSEINYSVEIGDYGFVMNNGGKPDNGWDCPGNLNSPADFMESQFQEFEDKKAVFVFDHQPFNELGSIGLDCPDARQLMRDYDNVVGLFFGHYHVLKETYYKDGFFSACAGTYGGVIGEQPFEDLGWGYRIVEIFDDNVVKLTWIDIDDEAPRYDEHMYINSPEGFEKVKEWNDVDSGDVIEASLPKAGNTDNIYYKVELVYEDDEEDDVKESLTREIKGNTGNDLIGFA